MVGAKGREMQNDAAQAPSQPANEKCLAEARHFPDSAMD